MSKQSVRGIFFCLVTVAAAVPLSAQVDMATLVGTVRDASGGAIPKATIVITNAETNAKSQVYADTEGNYIITPLKPGVYSAAASAPGFKTETRSHLTLRVNDRLAVDFSLPVGAVSETVEVSGSAPQVQTETSSLGEVIDANKIVEMPLIDRDYLRLATLTSGVIDVSGNNTNGNSGGNFVVNGTRGNLNNFLLDGIDNNSNDNGWAVLRTNVDAIEEFKVQTNSYSAEFGRSGGAVINATIKQGSNKYHGSGFEFFRNQALNARGFFEDPTQPKAPSNRHEFGGTIGGPIRKDKTFFFGDYQGTRIRQGFTFTSSVPLPAERAGDFSSLLSGQQFTPCETNGVPKAGDPAFDTGTIFNPASTANFTCPNGTVVQLRQPISATNILPQTDINSISQAFMNLYPDPNQPGTRNNYKISPTGTDRIDQFDLRLDNNFSAVDQLFGRFSLSQRKRFNPAPLPGLANGGNSSTGDTFESTRGAAIGDTHTFSPTFINEMRIGFNRVRIRRGLPPGGTQLPPAALRVAGVPDNPTTNGLTIFSPSGFRRLGDPGFAPTYIVSQEFQFADTLTQIIGRHTLKYGAQVRGSQFDLFQVASPRGRFSFGRQFTSDITSGNGGSSLADMLIGLPFTSFDSTLTDFGNRQKTFGGFLQDDFKVSPRLTLNLGLRYDYTTPITESHDRQSNFDFATGQIIVANRNGASAGLVNVDKADFAPRVGFAWSPFGDQRTVLHSAYGLYYSAQEIRTGDPLQLAYNPPFFFEPTYISDGITPVLTVAGGFPAPQTQIPGLTTADLRAHTPYYQHWNLSIQHQLPGDVVIETGYLGSKGTHLQVLVDRNQDPAPGPGDIQARRPFPLYGPFTSIENHGNSTFHALEIKASNHLKYGLSFLSAFTYGKAINDQPEICCNQPWPQNSYNLRAEKGLADFDQRRRWVTSFDYELPFGRGKRFANGGRATDLAFGGWHLGGILTFASGFPFTPQVSFDTSNTGSIGMYRADRLANGNLPPSQRTPDLWFDTNAFGIPNNFTFGNAGKNILDGPGMNSIDFSARKYFTVHEGQRMEFRAEAFNLLNHPNFAQPDPFVDDGPGAFGVITDLAIPQRQVQLALKYSF